MSKPHAAEATAIRVQNLSYRYPDGVLALNGASLEIRSGERLGLLGPNGAGKSTLLLHLNGVLPSDNGAVRVLDRPAHAPHLITIPPQVAIVFQAPDDQLFMPTVKEDVAFGPINAGFGRREVERRVALALDQVGLRGYEDRCPHHLSVGEKKQVALATALSMQPLILVLDEPTSNLDPRARRRVISLLQRLPHTTIVSGHDLEMIREICTRIVLLDQGKVVAQGAVDELLADRGLMQGHGLEVPYSLRPRPDAPSTPARGAKRS